MSNTIFYRTELFITDNRPTCHFLVSLHVSDPQSSIVVPLFFCFFTSYLSPFLLLSYCFTVIFSPLYPFVNPAFHEVRFHKRVSIIQCCLADLECVLCVCRYCQLCEHIGANKADYELILAKEAGNSFKPTKPFHQPPADVLKTRPQDAPKTHQSPQLNMHGCIRN